MAKAFVRDCFKMPRRRSSVPPRRHNSTKPYANVYDKWLPILEAALAEVGPYSPDWSPQKYAILHYKLKRLLKERYNESDEE
jgi:hypothetical protein